MNFEQRQERRKARYLCFRLQKEAIDGLKAPELPDGFKEKYEKEKFFGFVGGWKKFGVTWDLSEDGKLSIVPLDESLWVAWDRWCEGVAKPLPIKKKKKVIKAKRPKFKKNQVVEAILKREG